MNAVLTLAPEVRRKMDRPDPQRIRLGGDMLPSNDAIWDAARAKLRYLKAQPAHPLPGMPRYYPQTDEGRQQWLHDRQPVSFLDKGYES